MSRIEYKPSLGYDKDYKSDGIPDENIILNEVIVQEEEKDIDIVIDLIESLNSIKKTMSTLPEDIFNAIKVPIAGVQYVIGTIDPSTYNPSNPGGNKVVVEIDEEKDDEKDVPKNDPGKDKEKDEDTREDSPEDDFDYPDDFFSDIPDKIKIEVKEVEKKDTVKRQYEIDLISIFSNFIKDLEIMLNSYLTGFISIADETEIDNPFLLNNPYKGKTGDIKDKNLIPLSDLIIKLQIIREQKLRLFVKLFDIDETILHIRSCKVAKELLLRYYESDYIPNVTLSDVIVNTTISDSKLTYEKKYEENFYNLYRYLNSAVILIEECLTIFLKEVQAKAILIKREGIEI
jgi:hypothetical protein